MANTENIEAKLAAYVDDELDAAGRAEIEKHLAANPQHREMIAELREMRAELQALPRMTAPPEVAEMLGAQLERAALLGDVEIGSSSSATSFSRWPQVRAIAAIILITIGLATALYYILPSPKPSATHVALVLPETPANPSSTSDREIDSLASKPLATPTPAPALSGGITTEQPAIARLIIDTPDPANADVQLKKYLSDNRIAWQPQNANERRGGSFKSASSREPTTQDSPNTSFAIGPTTVPAEEEKASSNEIVAKMTSAEAQQLCFALSQQQQSAKLDWPAKHQLEEARAKDKSPSINSPVMDSAARDDRKVSTTSDSDDADRPLAAGETLRIRAHPAGAPGINSIDETVTVDADGFIALPTAGRIPVAGETPRKLSSETIPQAMARNKDLQQNAAVIQEMNWTIERAATALDTTRKEIEATTQPGAAGGQFATTAPSTQPLDAMLNGLALNNEEKLDVVIELRAVAPAASNVAPATVAPSTAPAEPAAAPATTQPAPATQPTTSPTTAPSNR